MRTLARYTLSFGAAAALLAACGGSQPPIGAPGAMPQSRAIADHAARSGSWMLPEAMSGNLLYALMDQGILVLTYPQGKKLFKITSSFGQYICADQSNGNVFLPSSSRIYEYAHGGSTPIAALDAPSSSYTFGGCSVDGSTGNLAVANMYTHPNTSVVVYPDASGSPATYTDPNAYYFTYCGYDDEGNLFVVTCSPELCRR